MASSGGGLLTGSPGSSRRSPGIRPLPPSARHLPAGIALLLLAVLPPPVLAAGFGEPGEVSPVEILLRDERADLRTLAGMQIDLDGVFHDRVRAYVLPEEVAKLRRLGFEIEAIPLESLLPGLAGDATESHNQYHNYAALTSALQQIAQDHPAITRLVSLGKSVQNRDLWMMKITRNPDLEEDEPEVHYISTMHGDEVVGKENCIDFINLLTDQYGIDPRITSLVDTMEIWVMPNMNPDGTELSRRYNANNYDLNRNFPDRTSDPVDSPTGRQPETRHVMNWTYTRTPVLSANFHGGALVTNYPYDGNATNLSEYTATQQDSLFVSVSRTYADNNSAMATSNSHSSFNNGICNGADWYAIRGGMQDWQYVWRGGAEVTIEVSNTKWPSASQLPTFWNQNRESMLAYLERAREGVRGIVTDALTGAPLKASIKVAGVDHTTYSDPDVGDYHRILLPGNYTLEVSATGYSTAVLEGVVVPGGQAIRRNVALSPLDVDLEHHVHRVLDGPGGNGWLDPGETADLAVTLRNLGMSASGVGGTLEPTGWHGRVAGATGAYPDIAAGATGESLAPHHGIVLDPAAPPGHRPGYLLRWSTDQGPGEAGPFFLFTGAPSCTTYAATDVPKAVLDRKTAVSTLSVPSDVEIAEIDVYTNISHPYIGDLTVSVVSPAGVPVLLHNRTGGSADDVVGWFDTDRTPAEPLSRFAGAHSAGTWTLRVNDGVPGDTGTLNSWSLRVCGRPFEASPPEMRLREVTRGAGGGVTLEWWPYPGLTSYRVYRSAVPAPRASFTNVTGSDPDPADTRYTDTTPGTFFYLVTGVSPAGEGPR